MFRNQQILMLELFAPISVCYIVAMLLLTHVDEEKQFVYDLKVGINVRQ